MLKNSMEDKQIDLEAPLLSVRRFSAGPAASPTEEGERRPPPPRRASLPFYKSDLKSGPVRVPGVVPFVWEQTPGLPKTAAGSDAIGDGKMMKAPKPPPGRIIHNGKCGNSSRGDVALVLKVGSSVRTRKAVTFAPDAGTAKSYESLEVVPKIVAEEKVERTEKEEKAETANRIEMPRKAEITKKVENEEKIEKTDQKVEKKLEKLPVSVAETRNEDDDDEDDAFSDALDTLSRSESFFMNCSVSGISGSTNAAKLSDSFPKDPEARDFMIERFLPAAQAMATDSPHYTLKKAAVPPREATKLLERAAVTDPARKPAPIPLQKSYTYLEQYAKELEEEDSYDEDDEDNYDDAGHFPSKGCGLLPKFCLLNPIPGVKVRGGRLSLPRGKTASPQNKNAYPLSLARVEELSWEAVYRKKLGQEYSPLTEAISKSRSESDSLTADCSSAFANSATGGTTPDKNDGHPLGVHERQDSVGILSRESNCSKIDSFEAGEQSIDSCRKINHSSGMGSESMSPSLDKTLRVDPEHRPGSSESKASSFNTVNDTRSMISSCEISIDSWSRESIFAGANEKKVLQPEVSKVSEPISPFSSEKLNNGNMNVDSNKNCGNDSEPLHLKSNTNPLLSLLPPPLPKSPSESWLSRTLPSVSSKNSSPQSLLGIRLQNRRQAVEKSSNDMEQEIKTKPSKPQRRQIQFAEVLAKPESQISEI
ncbi:uncharacterized protein LOC122040437 [Zingiber officinale]|uniref:Uncharacterized protein n=1 Tax=Zingiber officinale TaxID=94328 RepID=A0A8J5HKH5_ZINOF|nr:uncharacterized protein LOC122040437 [Zingiber officinale]KAG6526904.1 hypothetical protein ZIOFF_008991 [Zingiber officinale]